MPAGQRKRLELVRPSDKREGAPPEGPNNQRFRRYFDLGLIGMATTSPAKRYLEVNDELCRLLGYDRSELLQKNWTELTHPDDLAADIAQFHRVLAEEIEGYTLEKRWIRKDGQVMDSLMAATCMRGSDGSVEYFVGLILDTTERKRAEKTLRASEQKYRTLFESIDEGFCTIELIFDENDRAIDCRFLEVNPSFEKQTGIQDAEGRRVRELLPLIEDSWFEFFGKIALTGKPARFENFESSLKRWYDVYAFRIGGPQEKEIAVIFNDISARKLAQESQRTLAALVENSTDFIALASMEGQSLFVNPAGRQLTGIQPEDVAQLAVTDYVVEADREHLQKALAVAIESGSWKGEQCLRNFTTGARTPMFHHIFTVKEPETDRPIGLATIGRDMTELKRSEEELRAAHAALAHLSRIASMGELTASIAHEINQPLAAIVANSDACLRLLDAQTPTLDEIREAIADIADLGRRAAKVVAHVRGMVRRAIPEKHSIDINDVIREVLVLVRSDIEKHRTVLHTSLQPGMPPVLGVGVELQQVLINLLINGIEAMAEVCDRPRELLVQSSFMPDGNVSVSVQDSGVGLAPRSLGRVFEPFFTTKPNGIGMGLAIVRSIILAHGGRIWVTRAPEFGMIFQFTLPTVNSGVKPCPLN